MATLGTIFQKSLTDSLLDVYFSLLNNYSIEQVEYAAKVIIRTRTITGTFPLPAEFIQALEDQHGTLEQKAELAWTALLWGIQHVGHMQSVQFEDWLIHDTIKALGGWLRVCSADGDDRNEDWFTKNLQWRRKDFVAKYDCFKPDLWIVSLTHCFIVTRR